MSRYTIFDVSRLRLRPLGERINDLSGNILLPLRTPVAAPASGLLMADRAVLKARNEDRHTLFLCGGHVVRSGVQRYILDMMERGLVHGLAVNGAVAIHDYELALQNATTESVARYIREGQFGLWTETGRINDIVAKGNEHGLGFGEAMGKEIAEGDYPFKKHSLFAAAWRLGVPVTVHVGIGYDIIHAHPNCDGAAVGAASYRDFLIFAALLQKLGCVCSFGSAVMAPEVFLKALSMVRNVARGEGREPEPFTSLVCDILTLPEDTAKEAAKDDPRYYFRPWKTLLTRTVAGSGQSFYVRGRHHETVPALWSALNICEADHE